MLHKDLYDTDETHKGLPGAATIRACLYKNSINALAKKARVLYKANVLEKSQKHPQDLNIISTNLFPSCRFGARERRGGDRPAPLGVAEGVGWSGVYWGWGFASTASLASAVLYGSMAAARLAQGNELSFLCQCVGGSQSRMRILVAFSVPPSSPARQPARPRNTR